ncbi:MAG TPA: class I SAM-dependent methyltransferase [Acidimicrobiia bacterium]|nr:class I SAM-dependent methyltransferase [Acidimicrobiia bacterium]
MTQGSDGPSLDWNSAYVDNWAPWDIGRPQAVWIEIADEMMSPVLDSGCGTGEHALMLAAQGLEVLGIDISPRAIELAIEKAAQRGLEAEFAVGDVLELDRLGRRFATVMDSAVFHVFGDADRARYIESLASVLAPGGTLYLLVFSEHTPGDEGPRRVTQAELRQAFSNGWDVRQIEPALIEVREDYGLDPARAWLARVVKTAPTQVL